MMNLGDESKLQDETNNDEGEKVEDAENVMVMVRCRPLLKSMNEKAHSKIKVDEHMESVIADERVFQFDAVFGPETDNSTVYFKSVRNLIEFAFKGYNCTAFLYGQTGTGKTYTHSSLTTQAFSHLFTLISDSSSQSKFLIRASYYELYNEDIRDLLSDTKRSLELHESSSRGIYVKDLSCFLVNNIKDIEKLKKIGDKQRATAGTKMNRESSRSHSIFTITIETTKKSDSLDLEIKNGKKVAQDSVRVGRIDLVDLAGSERQSKSGSSGIRLKEASRINLSLTCLSLVIRALTDSKSVHIPYRNSKLTRLLSGSLGGNSKTLLLVCISPSESSFEETLNTLRFASRAKKVKNKASINRNTNDALLRKYKRQIEELREKLKASEEDTMHLIDDNTMKAGDNIASETKTLLDQLRLLKGKIMLGGENLLEKAELHDKLLETSRLELEQKRLKEQKLRGKLERKQQAVEKIKEYKETLDDHLASLSQKIKKALSMYNESRNEFQDLNVEHQHLKESLLSSIKETNIEIKYAEAVLESYIPRKYLDIINTHSQYDDESEEWQIKYIAFTGNNVSQDQDFSFKLIEDADVSNRPRSKYRLNRRRPYIKLLD